MTGFLDDSGNYLDYSGEDLKITKQVASFYDFKLKGDYTVDFKVPNTAKNRKTLGYYGSQQIVSPAFTQQPYTMVRNGNPISKGYLVIKGSDENNIDCFFVSGNSNWFDAMQFNVRDIIFNSTYTTSWDNMAATSNHTATEGVVFPTVDWCYNGNRRSRSINLASFHEAIGPTEPIQEAFPCLYMHTLVSQMANYAGLTVAGDLLSDPLFKRILITPDGPGMTIPDSLIKKTVCSTGMSSNAVSIGTSPFDTIYDIGELAKFDLTTYRYRCPIKGVYKIVVDYIGNPGVAINCQQYRGGTSMTTLQWYSAAGQTSGNMMFNFACEAGDELFTKGISALLFAGTTAVYSLEDTCKPYYIYNDNASSYLKACTGLVLPNAICPDITGIELIKSLCVMFGAYCTFDETARKLSINKLSKVKREDAVDWSKYYVSHYDNYQTGAATNNFIKYGDTPEVGLLPYNQDNVAGYGGWNLETSFDQVAYKTTYKLPFAGAWDQHPKMMVDWYLPYIKFYDLKDDNTTTWNFTSVTNSGGDAAFTSGAGDQPFKPGDLVRISGTFYSGYGIVANSYNTFIMSVNYLNYIATDTGTITKVNYSPVQSINRLLIASPGANTSDFGATNFGFYYEPGLTSVAVSTTCMGAWFDKPKMGLGIDVYTDSLALDTISNRDYNQSLRERYHQYVERIYNNPTIKAKLFLPAGAVQSFDFTDFVYLKTEKLTGYFFVQKIEWKDPQTEANVELLYLD